jgi:antitoxin ParD1/3/4
MKANHAIYARGKEASAMRVSLTPRLQKYVKEKVESGLYDDASEVVRDALRLMRETERMRCLKLRRLREELSKGETALAAGDAVVLGDDEALSQFFARL